MNDIDIGVISFSNKLKWTKSEEKTIFFFKDKYVGIMPSSFAHSTAMNYQTNND